MSDHLIVLPCSTCGTRLEIPGNIERFVCMHCGCEQVIHRGGGIIGLAPVMHGESGGCLDAYSLAVNRVHEQIRDLKVDYERTMNTQMQAVPAYVLLRFDLLRLGKIPVWNVSHVSDSELERVFRSLSIAEMDKIIKVYSANRNSPIGAWLTQVRDLRRQIAESEAELRRLQSSAGMAESS
jgi:hypothetical protein